MDAAAGEADWLKIIKLQLFKGVDKWITQSYL